VVEKTQRVEIKKIGCHRESAFFCFRVESLTFFRTKFIEKTSKFSDMLFVKQEKKIFPVFSHCFLVKFDQKKFPKTYPNWRLLQNIGES
jgi:hypothetical protein